MTFRILVLVLACGVLASCATQTETPAPVVGGPRVPAEAPAPDNPPLPAIAQPPAPVAAPSPPAPGVAAEPPASQASPAAATSRARIANLIPPRVSDRSGWAGDIYTAFAAMELPLTAENLCAVIAVTEQESGFQADPRVPGLPRLAWKEIEKQRSRTGIPKVVLLAALALPSPTGKSYSARLDAVKTERELSEIFEDFIGIVPLAKPFLANRNPVRTGGPMQVSVAYAEAHAASRPYPYRRDGSIRHEVFKRRGGMYFGIAHLLDYPAPYAEPLYRFADFNAGHYASRNAAFQAAVARLSGAKLALDGDLLRYDDGRPTRETSHTERALRSLAPRLKMSEGDIRRDLERAHSADFERSRLYFRVFVLADAAAGRPVPRALLPRIELKSPKITRKLTTDWFARRVDGRYRSCIARADS